MPNVSLSQCFNLHHHTDNGGPAIGWKVYTYSSRTTTKIDSYSDPAGTAKHTNPIVLDSRGEYPGQGLYLSDGVAYTLELCRPDGTSVATVDDVHSANTSHAIAVTLPPKTVYANNTEITQGAFSVPLSDVVNDESINNVASIKAVKTEAEKKLNNSGS